MEKVAILELNEISLRLSIYSVNGTKRKLSLVEAQPLNLGEEIVREELLSPQTKNKILDTLKVYRKMIENYKVEKIFAVVSNFFARARNYRGFIDEVYNNTGISFTIMSDEEVIKYLYFSVVNSIDQSKGTFLYIGAFKSYIIKYNRRTIIASEVLPIGTFNVNEEKETDLDKLTKSISKKLNLSSLKGEDDENMKFVGGGNAFLALGKISKKIERYPLDIDDNYTISSDTIEKSYNFIKGLELDKIRKIKGVCYDEADKIATGFAMIRALSDTLGVKELTVSTANIRDGLIIYNSLSSQSERTADILVASLENYLEFNKDEFSINAEVYDLSLILFKQLKVMHKLPRFYVKPLRIAAYMFDSGKVINEENYSKYSLDKILYTDIKGASHRELLIAGFIAVCQNLDDFSLNEWIKYKDILTDEDLDAVRKLGIIVKLAVNLNASRNAVIKDIVCDILGEAIIMKTVVEGDASYEILEGMNVAQDYKKVYKKTLQII